MSQFEHESEFQSAALNRLIRDMKARSNNTIQRTYNPDCPACVAKRMHTPADFAAHHPDAGSGIFEGRPMPNAKPEQPQKAEQGNVSPISSGE